MRIKWKALRWTISFDRFSNCIVSCCCHLQLAAAALLPCLTISAADANLDKCVFEFGQIHTYIVNFSKSVLQFVTIYFVICIYIFKPFAISCRVDTAALLHSSPAWQFELQILIWTNAFLIWTNTFLNLDKYLFEFGQIHSSNS